MKALALLLLVAVPAHAATSVYVVPPGDELIAYHPPDAVVTQYPFGNATLYEVERNGDGPTAIHYGNGNTTHYATHYAASPTAYNDTALLARMHGLEANLSVLMSNMSARLNQGNIALQTSLLNNQDKHHTDLTALLRAEGNKTRAAMPPDNTGAINNRFDKLAAEIPEPLQPSPPYTTWLLIVLGWLVIGGLVMFQGRQGHVASKPRGRAVALDEDLLDMEE